jgi:hypothetical protein
LFEVRFFRSSRIRAAQVGVFTPEAAASRARNF